MWYNITQHKHKQLQMISRLRTPDKNNQDYDKTHKTTYTNNNFTYKATTKKNNNAMKECTVANRAQVAILLYAGIQEGTET